MDNRTQPSAVVHTLFEAYYLQTYNPSTGSHNEACIAASDASPIELIFICFENLAGLKLAEILGHSLA